MSTSTIILGRSLAWVSGLYSQTSLAYDTLAAGASLPSLTTGPVSGSAVSMETQIGIYVLIVSVYALHWWNNRV